MFFTALIAVAIMLFYAVPGYILIKTKLIGDRPMHALSVLLMYVCQPCLTIYAFQKVSYSPHLLADIGIFFALALFLMAAMLAIFLPIFKKKHSDVRYRIAHISTCFGNCTFMGIPLLEAIVPQYTEAALLSTLFFIAMSILGWTVGSALITQDKSYISPAKAFLNPGVLSLAAALALFIFGLKLPPTLLDAVTLLGRMSTPLCMIIMGMRLATISIKSIFTDRIIYLSIAIKLIIMPLLGLLLVTFLPIGQDMRLTFYIMCCCPVASIVLNFSELLGSGQKNAASTVLLSTFLSVITIPLMLLVIGV